jgi:putative FmdB family regulatory protein
MPTYEYVCKSCGHLFEIVQSMKDDPLTACPECGGELRKVFAPPAISFKGSGFYATDHGKKSKQQEPSTKEGSDTGTSPGSSEKGSGSSEKKSEKKKDASTGSDSKADAKPAASGSGSGGSSS